MPLIGEKKAHAIGPVTMLVKSGGRAIEGRWLIDPLEVVVQGIRKALDALARKAAQLRRTRARG